MIKVLQRICMAVFALSVLTIAGADTKITGQPAPLRCEAEFNGDMCGEECVTVCTRSGCKQLCYDLHYEQPGGGGGEEDPWCDLNAKEAGEPGVMECSRSNGCTCAY